jgi:predicted amidohydrolase
MKIGIIQLTSVLDPEKNIHKIRKYLIKAKKQNLKAIFLPECFYSMGDGKKASPFLVKTGNPHYKNIQDLAKESGLYLIGGSAATEEKGKIYNRTYSFDPAGRKLPHYDKINLFSINAASSKKKNLMDEKNIYTPGIKPQLIKLENFRIGLSICFDLRFPELFRHYSKKGSNILSVSSAFTVPTGKAHWHSLLRARAIENQSFVLAAAQWGTHNKNISTFGHSLIIDPWGEILADAGEGEKLITAVLDLKLLKRIRTRFNSLPKD